MKNFNCIYFIILVTAFFTSCSTLEKASSHGFTSGYYKLDYNKKVIKVYVDKTDDKIDLYNQREGIPDDDYFLSIPLTAIDSSLLTPLKFRKQSLDIDMATILLKYRPSISGLLPQLASDINFSIYAGWRHDHYKLKSIMNPLGKRNHKITDVGYDFGFFAGSGATPINSFTTNNRTGNEYSGMIIQIGIAGFLESNIASFGVGVGFDYLLNRDREVWVYNNRPWVGFIVGIALN